VCSSDLTKIFGKPALPEILPEGAAFMTNENSVEYPLLAEEKYGKQRFIPAVVRAFIHREGPATAHHMGGMLAWSFGSIDPATEPLVQALYEALADTPIRSEERRVGKEWRSRRAPYDERDEEHRVEGRTR